MPMPRTLLAAALVAAVTVTPAAANDITGDAQDNVYTVSTSGNYTLANRVDATCAYVPDRWSLDWRPTHTTGTATTTGAQWTSVTCEIWSGGYQVGEATFSDATPTITGYELLGDAGTWDVMVCVSAQAWFRDAVVDAPRRCHTP
ncbi:MAG TPA: hypothetical protein VNQ77_02890 [Frankiaceae bacterium]|nr:hypothetical protein [Frankiaceae bacterium]